MNEASWQVITFWPGMSPRVVMDRAELAVDALGYSAIDVVPFVRVLEDGSPQLRVRGWSADGRVAREVLEQLRSAWPEVVR